VLGFNIMTSYISTAGTTQKVAQSLLEGNASYATPVYNALVYLLLIFENFI